MAELEGLDPRRWSVVGDRLTTWGGADYNLLLSYVLEKALGLADLNSDAQGITGLGSKGEMNPRIALECAAKVRASGTVSIKLASKFRDPSAFFKCLSPAMQRQEAHNAVPWDGMIDWLVQCIGDKRTVTATE